MFSWRSLLLILGLGLSSLAEARENVLPKEAAQALRAPEKATLYSLEPGDRVRPGDDSFARWKAYGHVELNAEQMAPAAHVFQDAVTQWGGSSASCFEPRHALRVSSAGHVYEFIICFECQSMNVIKDHEWYTSVGASGSTELLNAILRAAGIQLSLTLREADEAARERWLAGMPASIRPLWDEKTPTDQAPDVAPFRPAIIKEFPDARERALALFAWHGLGGVSWSAVSEKLLLDIPDADLIAAAMTDHLTETQLEGAVHLFMDWDFISRHPNPLPAVLKKKLLEHTSKSSNEAEFRRGQDSFGPEKTPEN